MPALKHSWTLFSSTLSTATPLTQLLSSRTSHAAYFFLSLCSESCWASVISVAFFEAESLFFIFFILSLFDVCSKHLWTNNFPSFLLLLPAFAPLCSFFFCPCMYNKVTGPYLTIFSSTHQLFVLFLSNKLLKRCDKQASLL